MIKLPRLSTIPSGTQFTDALARGIADAYARPEDPLALTQVLVLLPTRRAVRALTEAFGRIAKERGDTALLLPQIQPIGDVDEEALALEGFGGIGAADLSIPPAMDGMARDFTLAGLVTQFMERSNTPISPAQAMDMASGLSRFIDTVHTERVSLDGLDDLVPEQFAQNWQDTIEFLKIIREAWPVILEASGKIDTADRRNRLLEALAANWTSSPPQHPVIAAGTTGSVPATADLLKIIAGLDQGHIVLPGLDLQMNTRAWEALEPSHPQYGMAALLHHLEKSRGDIDTWPDAQTSSSEPRQRLINEALRPSAATDEWVETAKTLSTENACAGLSFLVAQHSAEEARAIALLMREAMETPEQTAALVTPDRNLARRVSAELKRFGLIIDDSAGSMLAHSPPATFFLNLIDAIATEWGAVPSLALLKHPFFQMGLPNGALRKEIDALERFGFRGLREGPGLSGLSQQLEHRRENLYRESDTAHIDLAQSLITRLSESTQTLGDLGKAIVTDWMSALNEVAMILATDEDASSDQLWGKASGEALATFIGEILEADDALGPMRADAFAKLLRTLMAGRPVRAQEGAHPRLFIWGPMEARLQQADLMILGGLVEKTWPAEASLDPWLSRPMRAQLGLSSPERQIGLSAHDFAQLAAGPRVVLSRAEKVEGQPAVASRWWLRLENLLKGSDLPEVSALTIPHGTWARRLDNPNGAPTPVAPPTPRPPVSARPRTLSVTDVEKWIRDPYSIYARHILKLKPLEEIDRDAGPAERGTLVHNIMEDFTKKHPSSLPSDARAQLLEIADTHFEAFKDRPEVMSIWRPRFERIADFVIDFEVKHRALIKQSLAEKSGKLTFEVNGEAFTLRGRADRIDLYEDETLGILDYKTGVMPSKDACETGIAPQVTLEAAMAARGAFGQGLKQAVSHLTYVGLKGGSKIGEVRIISDEEDRTLDLAENTFENFMTLIAEFDQLDRPYPSQPRPRLTNRFGDYDHLARRQEWSIGAGDGASGNGESSGGGND